MGSPSSDATCLFVLRVARPKGGPVPLETFHLRRHETALSVYRADLWTPRDVLNRYITPPPGKTNPKDLRAWEAQRGRTAEEAYDKGLCVLRLPISAFTDRGGRVIEDHATPAHLSIAPPEGEEADAFFQRIARPLIEASLIVPLAELDKLIGASDRPASA